MAMAVLISRNSFYDCNVYHYGAIFRQIRKKEKWDIHSMWYRNRSCYGSSRVIVALTKTGKNSPILYSLLIKSHEEIEIILK